MEFVVIDINSLQSEPWDASTVRSDACSVAGAQEPPEASASPSRCPFCTRAGSAGQPQAIQPPGARQAEQQRFGVDYFHCIACARCLPIVQLEHDCNRGAVDTFCPECDGGELFAEDGALVHPVLALACGHLLHVHCFYALSKRSGICPTCWSDAGCESLPSS